MIALAAIRPPQELRDNLPGFQAARETQAASRAEVTCHCTAGLTGETDREVSGDLERNSHCLCHGAIRHAKEVFDEPVRRVGDSLHHRDWAPIDELVDCALHPPRHRSRRRIAITPMGDGMRDDAPGLAVANRDTVCPKMHHQILRQHAEQMHATTVILQSRVLSALSTINR